MNFKFDAVKQILIFELIIFKEKNFKISIYMHISMLLVENTNYIYRNLSLVEKKICDREKLFF